MSHAFADIAFTPAVQALQEKHGSRAQYARMQAHASGDASLGPREAAFMARADSFYLATVSETGWPYVQHRGGPRGFMKLVAPARIAFADFSGNRQYISVGNAARDDRASIILVDYAARRRLKLLGRLRFQDPEGSVELPGYPARIERIAVFDVEAFDWNCPQHITPRVRPE